MTADRVRNYEKVELNSSVLRWRRNVVSDGTLLSVDGRVFQARAAAAENARSPSVDTNNAAPDPSGNRLRRESDIIDELLNLKQTKNRHFDCENYNVINDCNDRHSTVTNSKSEFKK